MITSTLKNIVYILGPKIDNLSPDTFVKLKIGMSKNNLVNFNQRLTSHQRSAAGDIVHGKFSTNETDTPVREHICDTYPLQFGYVPGVGKGVGREVIMSRVKDVPFLLEHINRYFNDANFGTAKLNSFPLRNEQKNCLVKTMTFYSDPINTGREFLWDCKMRFGKTHTAYELITQMSFKLIFILTGHPTDTKDAWLKAIDHVDFPDLMAHNFIDASDQKYSNTPIIIVDSNKPTIIFASTHDFAALTEAGFKEKFRNFAEFTFDLLIKDECHTHVDTPRTMEAIAKIKCKHILNLSGTPFRARWEERFSEEAQFTWSYINEQQARAEEIAKLGNDLAEKEGQYYWLCPMKIFTILLSAELYEETEQFTEEEGFTFTKLFAVDKQNDKYMFRNDIAVRAFINALCRGFIMPYSKQAHNSHQYKSISLKHALWYVPGVKEANLLAAMLRKHEIFKRYDIIIAAGDNGNEGNDTTRLVKERIAHIESGRDERYSGTITLSCGKLSHGVSIPEWGTVLNLSDMKTAQLYFQLIFRGQTPWKGMKNECYVFDFNPNRTLNHIRTLAKATANTGNIMPVLTEMLNVFNVLYYEGNEFRQLSASDLIAKIESGFGRSTNLVGLQNLFSELPFELDAELGEGLDDIEGGVSSKAKDIDVNHNDSAPNGKNTKRTNKNNGDSDDNENDDENDGDSGKDDAQLSDEQKAARVKTALKSVPLYFCFTGDNDFNSLVSGLSDVRNSVVCKIITGLPARSLKKILNNQSQDKKRIIDDGIVRFRALELKDHEEFQKEFNISEN